MGESNTGRQRICGTCPGAGATGHSDMCPRLSIGSVLALGFTVGERGQMSYPSHRPGDKGLCVLPSWLSSYPSCSSPCSHQGLLVLGLSPPPWLTLHTSADLTSTKALSTSTSDCSFLK